MRVLNHINFSILYIIVLLKWCFGTDKVVNLNTKKIKKCPNKGTLIYSGQVQINFNRYFGLIHFHQPALTFLQMYP